MSRPPTPLRSGAARLLRVALAVLFLVAAAPARADTPGPSKAGVAGEGEAAGFQLLPGLAIRSGEGPDRVWAEASGSLPFPPEAVAATLADPAAWCDFLALHLNTKACVHGTVDGAPFLALYSGRKYYEAPEDAYRLDYRFTVERKDGNAVRVALRADKGPLGTRDYRIEVEAGPGPQSTAARVRSSYVTSAISRAGTGLYLATLGRSKVGFSKTLDPATGASEPVAGVRGIIERNAVRYYLALDAFLQTRDEPPGDRFEASLRTWYDLTDRFPPLRELDREAYLESKRREHTNQLALQRELDQRGPKVLPGP